MDKVMGIYQISNLMSNKAYIGSSINIRFRLNVHKSLLKKGIHQNYHLQNSWKKYGEKCFKFSILEIIHDVALLELREQWWCGKLKEETLLYNIRPCVNSNNGIKHTEGTKKKMSISHIGLIRSEEHKKNISNVKKGIPRSKETIQKMSEALKGKVSSFKGKHHTKEAKRKISEAGKNRKISEETRNKMRKSGLGRKQSEEAKRKDREAHLGEKNGMSAKNILKRQKEKENLL